MAERPNLGDTYGNLNAAIDATKGKAKNAISEIEREADKREKALGEADTAEQQQVTRDTERGKKKQAVRKQTKAVVAEESAAIEQNERVIATETGTVDANTAAWRRNAAAKRQAATAGETTKYPGALQGSTAAPLDYRYAGERAAQDPSFNRARPVPPLKVLPYNDLALYEEVMGRKPGARVPIGVQVERGGREILRTEDEATYGKYASKAGWVKAASKARREEAKRALAEAKALDAESAAEVAQVAARPGSNVEHQAARARIAVENASAPNDKFRLGRKAEQEARAAAATTSIERGLTPEEQYRQDAARTRTPGLGTTVGDLSPAIRATKAPSEAAQAAAKEQAAVAKAAAKEEVDARKASQARMLEDQKASDARSLAEARQFNAARAEAAAASGRQALGVQGAGRGNYPPNLPPVAVGGAGGAGGGDEGGRIKAVAADEQKLAFSERDLNTIRAESNAILQRQLGAYASSSQALQRHGALTAEFIQALIRGEVTLKEFESQLGTTIGKFAGWAVAGGLVYGAYEGVKKLLEGVTQTQSGVEQLKRALGERVNVPAAEEGFRKLSAEVNVPIGGPDGSARAQFYAARVFHDQQQAQELAGTALRAFKLDEVNPQDAIKSFAALNVAFKSGPDALKEAFDQLDVGQLRFNARLNQTLPQVGRAAASFAAAGGTQKQLIDQIIQINRATGGGGGTGGGNPATALLREPANLTRPESEETLKRFGIDPKWARQHIGDFNQYVQELAGGRVQGQGRLSESDLQALSKAAGGGAGVGFRYLLPLFRLGQGNLPSEERRATENAKGSAEEDLKHKLSQLDEQFKKLGVDFEIFGSHVGSTGIEKSLSDMVSGINLVVKTAGLAVHPFAALGSTLSSLPTPIRDLIEAAALVGGLKLATKSRIGQTAKELAGESSIFLKAQGDPDAARKVRSALTTQRKDEELLKSEKANVDSQARNKAREVDLATANYARTARTPTEIQALGPLGTPGRDRYEKQISAAQRRVEAAFDAQAANQEASNVIGREQLANQKIINILGERKISLEEKIIAIREYEAHGVGGGAPTTNPLIYPNKRRALEEDQRLGRGVPALGGGSATASGIFLPGSAGRTALETEAKNLGAAADATAVESAAGQGLYVSTDAKLKVAGEKLGGYASKLKGLGSGLGNLFLNAGLLGRSLAAFAAIDIGAQALGGPGLAESTASELAGLKTPSSRQALEKQLEDIKKRPPLLKEEGVGESLYDVSQAFQHPIQGVESLLAPLGIGQEHPETFISDRKKQIRREAKAKQALLDSGKLALPGSLNASERLEAFQGSEEIHAHELGSTDKETVEGSKKQIEASIKLRLAQLKAFGSSGGEENIGYLTGQLAALSHEYTQSGNQTAFEELIAADESVIPGVIKVAQERLTLAQKFYAISNDGGAALHQATTELDTLFAGLHASTRQDRAELQTNQTGLAGQRKAYAERSGPSAFASPLGDLRAFPQPLLGHFTQDAKGKREESEAINKRAKETEEQQTRVKNREYETHQKEKEGDVTRAANDVSNFEAEFAKPRADTKLAEAGAGKVAKAEIALKLALREEARAIATFGRDKLNFAQLDALKEAVVAATEGAAAARAEARQRHTALSIASLPVGAPPSAKLGLEAKAAHEDEAEARAFQIPKGLKGAALKAAQEGKQERLEAAQTKNREAFKAIGENSLSESKQLSQLDTQIAEARDEGNAAAIAADQAAGAAKAQATAITPAEHRQATLDSIKAANAGRRAAEAKLDAEGKLKESTEPNTLEKDATHIDTLKKKLPLATHDQKITIHAELNEAVRRRSEDSATEQIDQIKFLEHTQRLTTDQGIAQLQKVLAQLKKGHASIKSIRAVETEIFDQQNQTSQDFAVGSIKQAPTLYDAKTLAARFHAQQHAPTGLDFNTLHNPPQLHQTNHISVVVSGGTPGQFYAEMERTFGGLTRAQLRSAGLV